MTAARQLAVFGIVCAWVAACGDAPQSATSPGAVANTVEALTAANCPAGYNVIQGTSAADTLIGTAGNDCILGLGGNDTIWGRGGNDYIAGGNGDDTINGEGGNDQLFGEAGIDTIHGGDDDDTIHGGDGADVLFGDNGDDIIDGDANADQIHGGAGDDVIYGDAGNDTLWGDDGDDALIGGGGTNTSDGGPGTDACAGTGCERPALMSSGCTLDSQCGSFTHCIADFGLCIGCVSDQDSDHVCDSKDGCPSDSTKSAPGVCGCGVADTDSDSDGTPNCNDACPNNAPKIAPGACGCGVADIDSDGDGTADCHDGCPSDPMKSAPGVCGCGVADSDGDGVCDPVDICPSGDDHADADGDGTPNACDQTPSGCVAGASGAAIFSGDLVVDGTDTSGDLAQLTGKVCVTGNLTVNETTLTDLSGLASLREIAGMLTIGDFASAGNAQLTSLHGLEQLTRAGEVLIANNYALASVGALTGLHKVDRSLSLRANNMLTSLTGLQNLTSVDSLSINGSNNLRDLTGLSGVSGQLSSLVVDSNYGLTSLDGLQGITRVTGMVIVWGGQLEGLAGLSGLTSVGTLELAHLARLPDLNGLGAINSVTWAVKIHDNANLTSLTGLSPAALTWLSNQISIYNNPKLLPCAIEALLAQTTLMCTSCTGNDSHVCNCPGMGGDNDGDGTCDVTDQCTNDPAKSAPGVCGCGVADTDNDSDGTADCHDACPSDPQKTAPGACGCGVADTDGDGDGTPNCSDGCPSDALKVMPGVCGCGIADADSDHDGVMNCQDVCAAGDDHADQDSDALPDACDPCPRDAANDADGDGICGDVDRCPIGDDHLDTDGDGIPNACDACPDDRTNDSDGDGSCDSVDSCPGGNDTADADHDGVCDHLDLCAGANDRQDDDSDGVVDHCEILRPATVVGAQEYFSKAGDLNADQKPDLLGSLHDFVNQGGFEFQAVPTSPRCSGLRLDDVDGDGHYEGVGIDGVSDSTGYHYGYWLCYGDAAGQVQPFTLLTPSISAYVYAGDVTGDGVTDVIVTDMTQLQVFELAAPPARGVVNVQTLPANRSDFAVYQLKVIDLDGDGVSEVVLRVWDGELRVYRHDGSGPLQLDLLAPTEGINGMDIGDVDGDGKLDLVTVARDGMEGNGGLALYLGLDPNQSPPSGSFGNAHYRFAAPVMFAKPYSMGYAMQGMGVVDLAGSPAVEILLQTELGLHVISYDRALGYRVLQRVPSEGDVSFTGLIADFNADGKQDVVQLLGSAGRVLANVACRTGQGPDADADGIPDACDPCFGPNTDADGDAVCDAADRCALGDDHLDRDQDGTPDACDTCPADFHNDSDGDGSCDSQDPCSAGDDSLDSDGDGICDALDICPNSDDTLDANYDGMPDNCSALTTQTLTTQLPAAGGYAAGDLDGDGLADLVGIANAELTTYHGLGDGNFEAIESQPGFDGYALAPVLADLDHDGHLDAVVVFGTNTIATVAYGDGTGHLELGQSLGAFTNAIHVGDLNGDGRPDIALLDNNGLKVWAGSAQRNGYAQVHAKDGVYTATIGDFDGDGVDELIGTDASGYFFHVARRPDGSLFGDDFAASYDRYSLQPQLLAAVDVDRDGRDELLVSGVNNDGQSWPGPTLRIYGAVRPARLSGYGANSGYGILDGYGLTFQIRSETTLTQGSSMQFADVVGDARPELLWLGFSSLSLYSWMPGPYVYLREYQTISFDWVGAFVVLDVEGDGRQELLQLSYGSTSLLRGPARP